MVEHPIVMGTVEQSYEHNLLRILMYSVFENLAALIAMVVFPWLQE